jgi:hypothetical protein
MVQMAFGFDDGPGATDVRPLSLGGLGAILGAIPALAGRPPVSALPELAALLIAGCTDLRVEQARALPAAEAAALAGRCLARSDLAGLVRAARSAVRAAHEALGEAGERSLP